MCGKLFGHVAVLLTDRELCRSFAVFFVDLLLDEAHQLFLFREAGCVMIAQNVAQFRFFDAAGHVGEMEKALVALGPLGHSAAWEHGVDLHGHKRCVDHLVLGAAGVDVEAADLPLGGSGVEGLKIDLLQLTAVHGIGEVRAEALQIQQ